MTSPRSLQAPARAVEAFAIFGAPISLAPLGVGRIHQTYTVTCSDNRNTRRYVLQRINTRVFRSPERLMENIQRVTDHLRRRLLDEKRESLAARVPSVIPTMDGRACYLDGEGYWWRLYAYVENSRSRNLAETPEIAYQGARIFGDFVRLLSDLPAPRLHETIPHFHDTPRWFEALTEAAAADSCNRAAAAADLISSIEKRATLSGVLSGPNQSVPLPERVVHNDTKIDNVLFDRDSDEGICPVDLDTVMPGLVLHDFGDLVRTTVNPAREDHADLRQVTVRLAVFEAVVRGYLTGAGALLTAAELDLLAVSGQVITLELAMRFLQDHLRGDVYFTTTHPDQNLQRARLQLRLLENLEARSEQMQRIVETARQA